MPQFRYVAFDEEEQRYNGLVEAAGPEAAVDTLSARFSVITELVPVKRGRRLKTVNKREELLQLTEEMAALLDSSISLKTALDIVVSDARNTSLYDVMVDVNAAVTEGMPLSAACRRHPRVFSRFYINMMEAGEHSGNLPEMLNRLAASIAKHDSLSRKLKATFTYPGIVLTFSFIVVGLLLTAGIPRIEGIYRDLGSQLPALTRALLATSRWLSQTWWLWGLGLVISSFVWRRWSTTESGALAIDRWKLQAPIGSFYRELLLTRFTRTLATLYGSGVPVLHALELAGGSIGNREAERLLETARQGVAQGASLGILLRGLPFFTEMALGLIHAGEATGSLSAMLQRVADYYESRYEVALEQINRALEPLLMITLGLMVGALVLVLGLPFMNLTAVV